MLTSDAIHTSTYRARWTWLPLGLCVVVLVCVALIEHAMGRNWICTCGTVKFWHGIVNSSENSQHVTDWYSFTHVTHGFIFFWFASLTGRLGGNRIFVALLASVCVEAAWELFENSDFVINRYREATISLDYYGDSIVNSVSDILCMVVGFLIARILPAWATVAIGLASEAMLASVIRDNLLLNILMLIYPLDAVKIWQQGI